MDFLVMGGLLFVLFLLLYPAIVCSIKVGGVRHQAQAAVTRVVKLEHALEQMRERVALLERREATGAAVPPTATTPLTETIQTVASPPPDPVPDPLPDPAPSTPEPTPSNVYVNRIEPLPPAASAPPRPASPAVAPPAAPAWLLAFKKWLFTGNLIAKFGLLILLIGIGYLITYTAQRVTVPIELRLAGVVLAAIALLLWGWRIRVKRRDVALPVQGAAVAILMVVVFGAFQRLQLIPATLAFALLIALTAFTCFLALMQNAIWLAMFGIIGGFAAPLLVSTGSGNHVALFSYYALLNTGVLALAVQRAWRALNLLGFAATFLVGGAWGLTRYLPDHYASAQAFLILFFLFYVGIALAWARKRPPSIHDAVDATLVFGTPAIAVAMQYGLVKDMPFGMAYSSLGLGLFYIILARRLQRAKERQVLLVATFTALATIFGTLAIPFAVTGTWTSAAWALEGTGLIWVGLRQRQVRTWGFGLLVQCGAWITFLQEQADALAPGGTGNVAALLMGAALLATAAIIGSWLLRSDDTWKRAASRTMLAAAGLWWFLSTLWWAAASLAHLHDDTVFSPIDARSGSLQVGLYTMFASASALVAFAAARKLDWPALRWFVRAGWIVQAIASFALLADLYGGTSWPTVPQALGWAVAWLCGDILLRRWQAAQWPMHTTWLKYLHLLRIGLPWLMLWPLCSRQIAGWLAIDPAQQDLLTLSGWRVSGSWAHFIPAWLMMMGVFWVAARSRANAWPTAPIGPWYRHMIIPAAACWSMLLALLWNLQQDGSMAPLPYLPILNPLDLSTAFALLLWLASYRLWLHGEPVDAVQPGWIRLMPRVAAFAAWGWLNMILLRTAAHYLAIDYRLDALAASTFVEAMLSLTWTVSALLTMRRARKLAFPGARNLWILGALLLGVVVGKLFLVDLSNTGSIARIVSFVGVGLLMVLTGYLAPYPADLEKADAHLRTESQT